MRKVGIVVVIFLLEASAMAEGGAPNFVAYGSVLHEQFGSYPSQENFHFVARSQGCNWSISADQVPKKFVDGIFAVGNSQGIFITWDLTTGFQDALKNGKTQAINNSQAVAMTNLVPNCTLAAFLGPVWLTYFSSCYLKDSDPLKMPVPVSLNVAGGSSLPLFSIYTEKSQWQLDEATGLPKDFTSIDDDGFLKGINSEQLVNLERYPSPFDKGFTNIVFHVVSYKKFSNYLLPEKAILEVYWVEKNHLDMIHRFTIETDHFEEAPNTPLPEPSTKGVAAVADGRLATKNGPIVLQYFGTNHFLKREELTNLDGFKEAVDLSLNRKPFQTVSVADISTARWIIIGFLFVSTIFFLLLIRKTSHKK